MQKVDLYEWNNIEDIERPSMAKVGDKFIVRHGVSSDIGELPLGLIVEVSFIDTDGDIQFGGYGYLLNGSEVRMMTTAINTP